MTHLQLVEHEGEQLINAHGLLFSKENFREEFMQYKQEQLNKILSQYTIYQFTFEIDDENEYY